jgi:NRPS condensation-like uncharacterized protein
MHQLAPDSPFYNVPIVTRIGDRLDVAALQWALDSLIQRHEALRTTFSLADGQPAQVIAERASLPLTVIDLEHEPVHARLSTAQRLAGEEARRPFDLETGPVIRAVLLRLAPDDHWLLLTLHHIVADGWSMGVLGRELTHLYEARLARRDPSLPELPIQYADFASWQRDWLQGDVL